MRLHPAALALALLPSLALAGCSSPTGGDAAIYGEHEGGTVQAGVVRQAGSSTVLPLAERWAEDFGNARGVQISVSGGGSGAGISGLCNGELDLGDASRRMTQAEIEGCRTKGVEPVEWKVAYDGLSVVVSHDNAFVQDLTVAQLASIFRKEGFAKKWSEVDPSFPATDIHLCYPGSDSGTYEYFNEVILNKGAPRTGAGTQQSEDDNVLVTCIETDRNAIGYFGYAYVVENPDDVRAVKVGGVGPSFASIADGSYRPLSRFLYIYTDGVPRETLVADYLAYVFHPEGGQSHVQEVGYVALDEATREAMRAALQA